ncbi:MAG TPA: oxidoreductase [Microscillaceae bacterium]|jgi:photosystem II stability/assembly factor-like uncharacterized protein|nr:oxidoreductase [Microscillaceae bacterium]
MNKILLCIFGILFAISKTTAQPNEQVVFQEKYAQPGVSLRGLCVVDERIIWASGSQGTILKSIDGGQTWLQVGIPGYEKLDFRDVHAFDSLRAVVINAGSPAYVFTTHNGGKNWLKVYENNHETAFLDDLAFDGDRKGLIFGDPDSTGQFLALRTVDGGKSWETLPAFFPTPLEKEAGFAASGSILHYQNGYIWLATGGGNVARVFYSTDEGQTWQIQTTPIRAGSEAQGIFSFCVVDALRWVAVGGDYKEASSGQQTAIYSANQGQNWQVAEVTPEGYRSGVAYARANTLVAVGTSGSSLSKDGGQTWQTLNSLNLNVIRFAPNGYLGYAAGRDGQICQIRWE